MAEDYRKYLDPAVISRLKGIDIKARLVVEGFVSGLHRGPYKGFSVEFAEHRQYMPGDSIRYIDWKVYGKTDRFYIKEYEEETNLRAYIIMDGSGSMGYSSSGITKLEYGCYLGASLAYLMLKQQDSVGLLTFDTKLRTYIPPRAVRKHLHVLLKEFANLEAREETDLGKSLHELAQRIKRRGLVILISDLLDDEERVIRGLKLFRHMKHEVIVFHVLDPYEVAFPFEQEVILRDMETGDEVPAVPWEIRQEYKDRVASWIDRYRSILRQSGIDYVPVKTSTTFDVALFSYLEKRQRLG
ncbi:MAG: DUF58 domain-containing protein [Candidatus Eisenbacteria bacterium]